MPAAVKLQTEYGDAIQVILVHSQAATEEESIAFALRQKWLGNGAIWTSERPFSTGSGGLPSYALLGPDGRVVLVGSSNADHSKIEKAIAEFVKKGSSAPEGAPDALAKAYKLLDEGDYAKARAEAAKVAGKAEGKDAATFEAATKFHGLVSERVGRQAARIRALAERSHWARADAMHDALLKGVKGDDSFADAVGDLSVLFDKPEAKEEASLEKELLKLAADAYEEGKDEKAVKKLQKFAADHAGSKVGERAQRIAALAEAALTVG